MIKMGKASKLKPAAVVEKAVAFFGPEGRGMKVVDQSDCCVRFEGGGGHVLVTASASEEKGASNVTVEGREWEYQIKEFVAKV